MALPDYFWLPAVEQQIARENQTLARTYDYLAMVHVGEDNDSLNQTIDLLCDENDLPYRENITTLKRTNASLPNNPKFTYYDYKENHYKFIRFSQDRMIYVKLLLGNTKIIHDPLGDIWNNVQYINRLRGKPGRFNTAEALSQLYNGETTYFGPTKSTMMQIFNYEDMKPHIVNDGLFLFGEKFRKCLQIEILNGFKFWNKVNADPSSFPIARGRILYRMRHNA